MIKTTFIASAVLFGAAAPATAPTPDVVTAADPVFMPLPETDVVAQIGYLELCHSKAGFELSITDSTTIFVDVEIGGFLIRIGA